MTPGTQSQPPLPASGYFEGERLELVWRYAYRPEIIPLLLDYLGAKAGMRILDLGCGTGFLSRLLAQNLEDIQVVALDSDENLLKLGRQMLARSGLSQIESQQGNAYRLPFPDGTFDLVTSHTLL